MLVPSLLFGGFFALKLFLWSLPVDQIIVFAIALPLGIAYFWAVFRTYGRALTGRGGVSPAANRL
jgi:hypothetical protein